MKDKMTSSSTNAKRPPRNATMRRKSRRKTPLVATAACVLAASSSGVEAFGQRPSGVWPSPTSISLIAGKTANRISTGARATLAKSHRRTSSLGYREGDADQSTVRRRQNARSASAVSSTNTAAKTSTRQNPAQESESERPADSSSGGGLLGLLSRGRRRITARNNHTENEQFDLDTYLEYIDRRYKRVHESDKKSSSRNSKNKKTSPPASSRMSPPTPDTTSSSRQGISTTLTWLSDSTADADCDAACQERRRQDALEVLGLAGLASAELLRRHQLPVPEDEANGKSSAGVTTNRIEEVPTSLAGPISFLSSSSSSKAVIDVEPTAAAATTSTSSIAQPLPVRALLFPTLVLRALLQRAAMSIAATGSKRAARVFTAVSVGLFCVVARPLGLLALKIGLGGLTGGQN